MRASFTRNITDAASSPAGNPIDMVEQLVLSEDWVLERRGDCEVVVERPGTDRNFDMFFVWSKDLNCLQITCVLDAFVKKEKEPLLFELLARFNEQVWTGHFSLWAEERLVIYRNSLLLARDGSLNANTLCDAVAAAIEESERFYPAFSFVLEHGPAPQEALDFILLPAMGEA